MTQQTIPNGRQTLLTPVFIEAEYEAVVV